MHKGNIYQPSEALFMRWTGLEGALKSFLAEADNEPLFIFSPFITTSYAKELLDHQGEVHIITSWRKDHLISGVSDLELYNLVKATIKLAPLHQRPVARQGVLQKFLDHVDGQCEPHPTRHARHGQEQS